MMAKVAQYITGNLNADELDDSDFAGTAIGGAAAAMFATGKLGAYIKGGGLAAFGAKTTFGAALMSLPVVIGVGAAVALGVGAMFIAKKIDEYQEMAKELKKERKQIRNLKMNNALLHLKINKRPTPSTTAKDRINAKPGENIGEKSSGSKVQVVKMAQEKKFNQEKEKSKRIEAEAIEESEDKMRASLAAIEQDRQQLEEKRDVAIQQIAEVVKEKESQRELIGEKRASKNSLRPLVLKQMKYLKAKEAFELQLQTLKMKKEKAEADHAAEVVRAQQHTRKSMSKLVRKNRKILNLLYELFSMRMLF